MKMFRFNLQRLLDLRRHKEREWEWKLAAAAGACVITRDQIEARRRNELRTLAERGGTRTDLDLNDLFSRDLFRQRMEVEINSLTLILAEKEAERKEIQADYIKVSRKRKALERLRERREAEYRKLGRREEYKELDDINNGARQRVEEE